MTPNNKLIMIDRKLFEDAIDKSFFLRFAFTKWLILGYGVDMKMQLFAVGLK